MFWNTTQSDTTPSEEATPRRLSATEERELEAKIEQEVKFQRINSIISGNEPLSCMKTFDKLLSCYSVSTQIKSIYRYGNLDYDLCNLIFKEFKTCFNLKFNFDPNASSVDHLDGHVGVGDGDKIDLQSLHWNLRKARKVFDKPNSQDVWEARQIEPLELTLFK